ncbi:hypothetical protein AB0G15_05615 [Streptosporangium sp. NPDC023825]|uniref:hypothetical protein n=1 Tax=Streptosporangium sp. NPDC023825 TaxID=3154909 RepID=UPI0034202E97
MRHVAITIEGVLRDPITGQPDERGRELYHALANNYRVTLLADRNVVDVADWLFVEGFTKHTKVIAASRKVEDPREIRLKQIRLLRTVGDVDLVITSEPLLVDDFYTMGQPHLLFIQPKHLGQLPPRETWDELTARVDDDRRRAAALHDDEDT